MLLWNGPSLETCGVSTPSIKRRKSRLLWKTFPVFRARRVRYNPAWHYGNGGPFTVHILFPAPNLSFGSDLLSFLAGQDQDGALLDAGDMIPEKMSKLLPEVKDEKGEDEAQPGTGASFRFPNSN